MLTLIEQISYNILDVRNCIKTISSMKFSARNAIKLACFLTLRPSFVLIIINIGQIAYSYGPVMKSISATKIDTPVPILAVNRTARQFRFPLCKNVNSKIASQLGSNYLFILVACLNDAKRRLEQSGKIFCKAQLARLIVYLTSKLYNICCKPQLITSCSYVIIITVVTVQTSERVCYPGIPNN